MDIMALLSSTPPAVAIEEPVWEQLVKYPGLRTVKTNGCSG